MKLNHSTTKTVALLLHTKTVTKNLSTNITDKVYIHFPANLLTISYGWNLYSKKKEPRMDDAVGMIHGPWNFKENKILHVSHNRAKWAKSNKAKWAKFQWTKSNKEKSELNETIWLSQLTVPHFLLWSCTTCNKSCTRKPFFSNSLSDMYSVLCT